jgi:hypothetical protein
MVAISFRITSRTGPRPTRRRERRKRGDCLLQNHIGEQFRDIEFELHSALLLQSEHERKTIGKLDYMTWEDLGGSIFCECPFSLGRRNTQVPRRADTLTCGSAYTDPPAARSTVGRASSIRNNNAGHKRASLDLQRHIGEQFGHFMLEMHVISFIIMNNERQ